MMTELLGRGGGGSSADTAADAAAGGSSFLRREWVRVALREGGRDDD